jgi:hypothetical protein
VRPSFRKQSFCALSFFEAYENLFCFFGYRDIPVSTGVSTWATYDDDGGKTPVAAAFWILVVSGNRRSGGT